MKKVISSLEKLYSFIGLFTYRQKIFLIFIVALIIRSGLFINNYNCFPGDGFAYHNIAVNLIKGNGYSSLTSEPYPYTVFREPAYPIFLASVYSIPNIFYKVDYIRRYDRKNSTFNDIHPEIIFAKIIQILLSSISIVLIFFITKRFIREKLAFIIAILAGIYIPYAYWSVIILRDCLMNLFLLLTVYSFVLQVQNEFKTKYVFLTAFLIGVTILNLQANLVLLPVYIVLVLIKTKSIKKTICFGLLTAVIAILLTTPWTLFVYNKYPDIRVFKTFGSSFTQEMRFYDDYVFCASDNGLITEQQRQNLVDWGKLSKIQFDRSFKGIYKTRTDSISKIIIAKTKDNNFFEKYRWKNYINNTELTLGLTFNKKLTIQKVMKIMIKIIGLVGFVLFFRRTYPMAFVMISYLAFSWLIGDDQRRVIIVDIFFIIYSVLFILYILRSLKYRRFQELASVLVPKG
jgi:4-amino-4-deoxy-L-arabinose transferase-like glycosyltransferase